MRISGCIITLNEEVNITQCIKSMKGITDEIIVVDTGSEDKTVEIAEELGAVVYQFKWVNDFSKAKNYALEHAKGDWIIFLDADEYFHEDSVPKVRSYIQNIHSNGNVDSIKSEIVNIDKDSGRIISYNEIIRIFRNKKKIRYVNKIHEELRNNGAAMKCINSRDGISIIHTGYSDSQMTDKALRNLQLLKSNQGEEKSAYYLATTSLMLQDFDNAYTYAESALAVDAIRTRDDLAYKMHLIRIFVTISKDFSNDSKIQGLIEEANQKYGNHPEIARLEAIYLCKKKLYGKALEKFLFALDCNEKYGRKLQQNDFPESLDDVYYNIAEILYLINREPDALEYYVKALRSKRYHINAFKGMFALCKALPEQNTISFINSIYNIEIEEDMKFIISHIATCGRTKLVLYYASKWNKTFGKEDDVLIYALISQGNYSVAMEIAMIYLKMNREKFAPLVTSVIILGQLFSEAEKVKNDIGEDYFSIISSCADHRKFAGNVEAYLATFSTLVKFVEQYDINNYLKLGSGLGVDAEWNIANIFLSDYQFAQAAHYFKLTFESLEEERIKAETAYKAGFCFYKLKNYEESLNWFEKAIANGYSDNDLTEFLRTVINQSSDDKIKNKAGMLLSR